MQSSKEDREIKMNTYHEASVVACNTILESQNRSDSSNSIHCPSRNKSVSLKQIVILSSVTFLLSSFKVCMSFSTGTVRARNPSSLNVIEAEAPTFPRPHVASYNTYNSEIESKENSESSQEEPQEPTSEPAAESDNEQNSESEASEAESRLQRARRAAALLSRRRTGPQRKIDNEKTTSVGSRRIGSATKARGGVGSMTRLTDAVRRSAGANTVEPSKPKRDDVEDQTKAAIQNTVNNFIKSSTNTMGILGEASNIINSNEMQTKVPPGTVLVECPKESSGWKAADRVSVRVATPSDDFEIANLRLSVFSNFSPNMRQSFCSRSCHVLASRRNQGASCIVATVPRYGSILSSRSDIILGTAECSIHEFYGTELGSRRMQNSVLYITEVAVQPTARRKGIGSKLMQSIDELARRRGVETLYLHVDVANAKAISLYEGAGFARVPAEDEMYSGFTRSLNLHDGAMRGRNHYLLYKDISQPTWLPGEKSEVKSQRGTLGIEIAT